ncbi:MAG TPA: cupredoxin family copper-binding protein [Rhizomicrobium sp.]|jgi:plastocyanin|nr:cupredoxin family copper-binding protein [Rhizomicrobium sp.]
MKSTQLALALALLLLGFGGASAQQRQPQTTVVQIKNFDFSPMDITIKAGSSVTWKNLDGEPHTVTSVDGLFRSGAIDQDETFTFKFDKPGVYKYLCSIHPRMRATITVN